MEIETQIKKGVEYYYLKHSIRKGKKVISKRKYLGTLIPNNLDEIKHDFYLELNKDLFEKLDLIKENHQKEWAKLPQTVKEKELKEIAVAFTYNTNAIEGSTITLFETREIILEKHAPAKALNEIEETKNHAKVFLEALNLKQDLDEKLILKWHLDIFKDSKEDIAGEFRDYLVRVGSYLAPHPEDMKEMLKEFFKFAKKKHLHPVEFAGRLHYLFEKIHPFGDGNGRIGRLLMNYILWQNGYPMIIIEYKNRKSYYKAFDRDEQGFADYFIKRYIKIHEKRI